MKLEHQPISEQKASTVNEAPLPPRTSEFSRNWRNNPMQMETIRFRRRFLNVSDSVRVNNTLLGMVVFLYAILVSFIFVIRDDVSVAAVLIFQQMVVPLVAAMAAHSAIAGERDRRSWDLLLVAPITQKQIVFGKFRSVLTLALMLQAIFLPMVLIGQIFGNAAGHSPSAWLAITAELLCTATAALVSACSINLSSRLKNANAALVAALASLIGVYAVVPLLWSVLESVSARGSNLSDWIAWYHPIYLLAQMMYSKNPDSLPPVVGVAGYAVLTYIVLRRTARRLTKAE